MADRRSGLVVLALDDEEDRTTSLADALLGELTVTIGPAALDAPLGD